MTWLCLLALSAAPRALTAAELTEARKGGDVVADQAFAFESAGEPWRFVVFRGASAGLTVALTSRGRPTLSAPVPAAARVRGVTFVSEGQRRHALVLLEDTAQAPMVRFFEHQTGRFVRVEAVEANVLAMLPRDAETALARAAFMLDRSLAGERAPVLGLGDEGQVLVGTVETKDGVPAVKLTLTRPHGKPLRATASCRSGIERTGDPVCTCEEPLGVASEAFKANLTGLQALKPVESALELATAAGALRYKPKDSHAAVVQVRGGRFLVTGTQPDVGLTREALEELCVSNLLALPPLPDCPACAESVERLRAEYDTKAIVERAPELAVSFLEGP